jgi:hypothetical protein
MKVYKLIFKGTDYLYENLITCEYVEHTSLSIFNIDFLKQRGINDCFRNYGCNGFQSMESYINVDYDGKYSNIEIFSKCKNIVKYYNRINKIKQLNESI